jgi:O-antigen ligase
MALPLPALFTLSVAAIPLVQLVAGLIVFRGDAAVTGLYIAGFALAQVVGHRAVALWGEERSLQALCGVLLIGALASAWLALCQWQRLTYFDFAISELPLNARPFANLNQPNLLATLLVLGMISTAALHSAGSIGVSCAAALVALLGFALAMTQSRASVLELLVVGTLLIIQRRRFSERLTALKVLTGLALVVLMAVVWQAVRGIAPAIPPARDTSGLMEIGARGPHWAAMLDAIGRQPWFGYGWGQGAIAQYAVAPDHPAAPGIFDFGHNLVLDLLLWNGVPLGALIVVGLLVWFAVAVSKARSPSTVLLLAFAAAVFAHAMVEYPLYYASFLLPIGAVMGAVSAVTMPRAAVTVPRWVPPAALGTIFVALLIVVSDYLRLEEDVRSLRFERARIGLHRPRHVLSEPVWLTHMGAFTHFVRSPLRPGMTEAELHSMAIVVQRFPSSENILRYAAGLAMNDKPGPAAGALRRVCKMERQPVCDEMTSRWHAFGKQDPKIAAVPWPKGGESTQPHDLPGL